MKLLLLQTDIIWNNPAANRARAGELIAAAEPAELIVLPEMFTTGFCTEPEGIAEAVGAETLPWMQAVARKEGAAVAGSVATEEDGHYYNRFYFVRPDGSYAQYDKRHLFSFAGEDRRYTSGGERVVVEYNGWRILLQVCYDLRFPVFARNRGDYDMILYVADWPAVRIDAWNTLLKARAIENQCYVAGVNRTGSDPYLEYNGSSALIDFLGQPAAEAPLGREAALNGSIDREALAAFRERFPALGDADTFSLDL